MTSCNYNRTMAVSHSNNDPCDKSVKEKKLPTPLHIVYGVYTNIIMYIVAFGYLLLECTTLLVANMSLALV